MKFCFFNTILLGLLFFSSTSAILTCIKKHRIRDHEETCQKIVKEAHITIKKFYNWNPSLKRSNCASLHVGQTVCISAPISSSPVQPFSLNATSTIRLSSATTTPTATRTATTKKPKITPRPTPSYLPGLTVSAEDGSRFCLLLPSSPGNSHDGSTDPDAIANSEKDARAFCTEANMTPGAQQLPDGFITSALYQFNTTAEFIQVTGKINRTKYSLSAKDGGGQYDNHGAGSPPLSTCIGYRYYVSLIEPDIQDFCIRCCQSYQDCNASRSAYGCKRVIPPLQFSV